MDDLIARFQQSHEALAAVIARFSDEDLTKPGAEGTWSAKELMAHIAAWNIWTRRANELRLTEDNLPAEMVEEARNPDPFNARAVEAWKGYDATQARAAFDKAYTDLIDFLTSAPHDQLYRQIPRPNGKTTTPLATLKVLVGHNDEHRAHLEEALGK